MNYKLVTPWVICLMMIVQSSTANEIAYLRYADGFWQVFTIDADGTGSQQITDTKYDKIKLSWYPDGKHLLVNANQGKLYQLNVHTRQETQLTAPLAAIADAVISPDGNQIAFSAAGSGPVDRNDIWLMDEDGSNLKRIIKMQGLQHEPVWSADGNRIYFLSGIVGAQKQHHDVYHYTLETRSIEQITFGQLYHFDIAVNSSDELAYSNNQTGNYEIWTKATDKEPVQLTNDNAVDAKPSWSPDAKQMVFESSRSGLPNIWLMDLNNKKLKQLTDSKDGARYPVWYKGAQ